jgi:hypothetical protein
MKIIIFSERAQKNAAQKAEKGMFPSPYAVGSTIFTGL